ncbi:MAG: hypothetical protein WCW61_03410 [Patescibacteria group bacterium]|jgi:hypothetical protein
MKKLLVNDIVDFLEKLEEIKIGKIKIAEPETVMNHLLAEGAPEDRLSVCLIPDIFGRVLMFFPAQPSALFEFIETSNLLLISYIQVAHVSRLFIYAKEIYLPLDE